MTVVLLGACIATLGVALIAAAERLRERALLKGRPAPERLRPFYRWWTRHLVQRRTYVWSYRLVGVGWVLFGLVLVVGGFSQGPAG